MTRYWYIVFFGLIFSVGTFAQTEDQLVERDGKYFFEYKVEKGKTFYGLQRQFDVTKDDLIKNNPALSDGLKKGQTIYVPVSEKYQNLIPKNQASTSVEGRQVSHVVEKGETLYGISKKYGVTVDELVKANPGAEDGLKIGAELYIPGKGNADQLTVEPPSEDPIHNTSDSTKVKHILQKGETLYSLSKRYMVSINDLKEFNNGFPGGFDAGDTILIPVRKEITEHFQKEIVSDSTDTLQQAIVYKEKYVVSVLAPIQLSKNAAVQARRKTGEEEELYGPTKIGVDFFGGIKLAIDSLTQAGISVDLRFYDTAKDTGALGKILRKPELAESDLIIGPFHNFNVKIAAKYAKEHKIHLVVPVATSNKVLFKNPYVSRAVTSTTSQLRGMAKYIAAKYPDANVILVDSKKSKDKYMLNVMKKALTKELTKVLGKPTEPKMSYVTSYDSKHLHASISKEKQNIIIACSKDQGFATNFMTKINTVKNSWDKYQAEIKVFVLDEWEYFNSVDDMYKKKLNMHYVSNRHIDYDSSTTVSFLKAYRAKMGYDPNEFGFMGFDLAYNYIGALAHFGTGFPERVGLIHSEGVHTKFNLVQVQEGSGFENRSVYIIRYEGYNLIQEQ